MKIKFVILILFIIPGFKTLFASPSDSTLADAKADNYIPLSLMFSGLNNSNNEMADSTESVKWKMKEEKPGFFKDYIYVIGTAAVAAIIYFLWPEDNPAAQRKFTFGTPPPPK